MSNKPSLYSRRPQHNDKYISESNGSEGTTASDSEGPNLDRPNTSSAAAGPPTQKQCRSKPGDSSGSDSSSSKQDYRSYQSSSKHDDCNGVGGGTRDHRATSASRDRASAQPMGRGTQGEALTSRHGRGAAGAFTSSRPRETYSRDMKTPIGEKSQLYGDESSRLSVLMKRVMREDDRRSSIVKQLREYMQTANPKVISKQADNVLESLQDLLQERGSSETKQELARCVGITGSVMGDDPQRYFNSVFGRVNAASTSDDVRVHLLKALMETLAITKERKVFADCLQAVMRQLQVALETAVMPDVFTATVDLLLQIVKIQPKCFNTHFRDTVDILVGWHIDSTQRESLIVYAAAALTSLQQFWVGDLSFSVTLLGQFLEDMEAYSEDLCVDRSCPPADPDLPSSSECISKITSLIRVFTTVVRSIGKYFQPTKGPPITTEYIVESLNRIMQCVLMSMEKHHSDNLILHANHCVIELLAHLHGGATSCVTLLADFVEMQLAGPPSVPSKYLLTTLALILKVIQEVGGEMPVAFVSGALRTERAVAVARFSGEPALQQAAMQIYQALLGLKNVLLLDVAYRHLLIDMQRAVNALLTSGGSQRKPVIVEETTTSTPGATYTPPQARHVVMFLLGALTEIATTSNSIIGMWALTPSLFELLCHHLDPGMEDLAASHPVVQYCVLRLLNSLSTRHGNFISTSCLLSSQVAQTSGHLSKILTLLTRLLRQETTSWDARKLAVQWCEDILQSLQVQHAALFPKPEFCDLVSMVITSALSGEDDVTLTSVRCLQLVLKNVHPLSRALLKQCIEVILQRLNHPDEMIRDEFATALRLVPNDVLTSASEIMAVSTEQTTLHHHDDQQQTGSRQGEATSLHDVGLARRQHVGRVPMGTFHTNNFRSIMAFILIDAQPSKGFEWLERLHYSCQRSDKLAPRVDSGQASESSLILPVQNNLSLLMFFATYESAQYCVMAKLRTPLGKPQDTFTSIEAVIKLHAAEIAQQEQDETKPKFSTSTTDEIERCFAARLRVNLLMNFLEHLDKLMYNAYEGCAVAMNPAPKVVRTFFRTNRATCQEWLHRVRAAAVQVALHCGLPAVAVHHAMELLAEMKAAAATQTAQFEQVVCWAVLALVRLRCGDAIQGVYAWLANLKLSWIKPCIDMASGRYELAAKELRALVEAYSESLAVDQPDADPPPTSSSSSPPPSPTHKAAPEHDPFIGRFLVQQVAECYVQLGSWTEVLRWQERVKDMRSEHGGAPTQQAFTTTLDTNYVRALSSFEQRDYRQADTHLQLVSDELLHAGVAWEQHELIDCCDRHLLRQATNLALGKKLSAVPTELENIMSLAHSVLRIGVLDSPPLLCPEAVIMAQCAEMLQPLAAKKTAGAFPFRDTIMLDPQDHYARHLGIAIRYVAYAARKKQENGLATELAQRPLAELYLTGASLARKQQNLSLARDLILALVADRATPEGAVVVRDVQGALRAVASEGGGIGARDCVRLHREGAKLLSSLGQTREAVEAACGGVVHVVKDFVGSGAQLAECQEPMARSLLDIAKWLQQDQKHLASLAAQLGMLGQGDGVDAPLSATAASLATLLARQEDIRRVDGDDWKIAASSVVMETDAVLGRLLHLSALTAPGLAKAWSALASWCYKWGRKSVDNASHGSVGLLPAEQEAILDLLPKGLSLAERESVLAAMGQIHGGITTEQEDITDQDQSLYDDGDKTMTKQLLAACPRLQGNDDIIDSLLKVWRNVVHRVYYCYQLSARGYFMYLKLAGEDTSGREHEDGNITATLRLLRLVVKHAGELRAVLESGLAATPSAPWKGIIPQLFSRLSHPEQYVRQSVSELLCRVALDAPHLIVYPAVVGCAQGKVDSHISAGLLSKYLTEASEEPVLPGDVLDTRSQDDDNQSEASETNDAILNNCFTAIVDMLSQHSPQMIAEMQLLVQELRRVTLLWDELWLGTLNQHHSDVNRRLAQLDSEVKKVVGNMSLSKEEQAAIIRQKHNTVLKPTMHVLEQLQAMTSQAPETPHECWFQETFGELIRDALERLANPANPSNPAGSWQLFRQLHHTLQQRAQKRGSFALTMDQISTKLANLKVTAIPMPGLNTTQQVVTIQSVTSSVQVLPTKTKPKKLVLRGCDGRRYTYLFKGLEDLHLDERIMQFLTIVNNMFAKSNRAGRIKYQARHYSVTPLGPRSGLIQWVDGATPLFGLYKRWQQREAVAQVLRAQANASAPSQLTPTVPRPSEIYYNKLTPALKEKGVTNLENRREWPLETMTSVLRELMAETPADLLAKELWCSSSGATEWWNVTQQYARSTAVMSMIGYIIGLGDRHLDNILVDLTTGEAVHIDYNVCFEKGRSLRVPEKVPFRMSQNIETALGVTGIEGVFRNSCEHVLRVMRRGRETLLTLLEAFVYDPLVDWTTGNDAGYAGAFYGGGPVAAATDGKQSKRVMEREITFSMFSIRVAEMRTAWLKNRDEMETALPRLSDLVQDQLSTQQSCEKLSCQVAALKQQTLMLEEACADKGSALYTLAERYSGYAVVLGAEKSARAAFQEKLTEWEQWHQLHKVALNTIRGPGIALMFSDLSKPLNLGVPSFEPVVEFLQNAGQSHTVQQCEQCESELSQLVHQRRVLLRSCMEQMHTYCTVVAQYPPAYLQINRVARWSHWLRQLLDDWTQSRCQQVVSEFHRHYGDAMQALSTSQSMLAIELKLSSVIADTNTKLLKLAERHNQEAVNPDHLQQAVEETSANITKFVQENRTSGSVSLASVVITALCALNKRYLVMEGAAAAAGDRLMDLTSRDGDWFLDELCSMSANVCQLVALLQQHYSLAATGGALEELAQRATVVTRGTHHVYLALQDLNTNFRKIILPEACKRIQSEEPSVAVAVATLNRLVHDAGMPLDSLLGHMDTKMRNIIMGIGQVDSETTPVVDALKRGFAALLRGDGGATVTAEMTAGQMLLMGFNGLFTRLSDVHADVAAAFTELEPPPLWRKIDVVREARGLQMCVFGEEILSLLEDIFFIKKLQAMREFFDICCKLANTLYDKESTGEVYDDEQLSRPIKHYIAEFVRKKVIGLPSQVLGHLLCVYMHALGVDVSAEIELKDIGAESKVAIEDLCKKAVEAGLREGRVQHTDLTQASTLTSTHDTVWRKQDLVRRLGTSMMLLQSSMATAKMQLTRFQWLHEDALTQAHGGQLKTTPSRSTVMSDMRKAVQVVLTLEPAIAGVQEKYAQQEASISQRLRWAAGANQSLQATLDKFEQASRDRTDFLLVESKIAVDISNLCNSVLHCEALRTRTPEAINGDRNFVVLINRCQESYVLKDNCSDSVSPLEASLVEQCPLPAAAPVMLEWVQTALACVVTATDAAAEAAAERERAVERCRDGVRGHVTMIRNLLATHHKLMSDVRSILKTMAKYEEEQQGEAAAAEGGSSVRTYISLYRGFSESFSGVLKNIMAEEQLNGTADDVAALLRQIPRIYDGLVEFASPITQQSSGDTSEVSSSHPAAAMRLPLKQADAKDSKPSPVKPTSLQMFFSSTPPGGPTGPKSAAAAATSRRAGVARDPRTGKALQERNSYAIGVWRRIKMKLDGRDPDPARRLNVPEQVDFVIKEATNIENLALLYEGWTPWV